MTEIAEFSFTV